jgi:hypothetical protein
MHCRGTGMTRATHMLLESAALDQALPQLLRRGATLHVPQHTCAASRCGLQLALPRLIPTWGQTRICKLCACQGPLLMVGWDEADLV